MPSRSMKFTKQDSKWYGSQWGKDKRPPRLCADRLFDFFDIPEAVKAVTITLSNAPLKDGYKYRYNGEFSLELFIKGIWDKVVTYYDLDDWIKDFAKEGYGNITYDEQDLP